MKALKSKKPYLLFLGLLFCIAVTDSFLWGQKIEPVTVFVEAKGETDIDAGPVEKVEPELISSIQVSFKERKQ